MEVDASAKRVVQAYIDNGRNELVRNPELTATELLDAMQGSLNFFAQPTEESVCRHCDQSIALYYGREKWVHTDPDESRGCRAASFRPDEGWNESLDRQMYAQPARSA